MKNKISKLRYTIVYDPHYKSIHFDLTINYEKLNSFHEDFDLFGLNLLKDTVNGNGLYLISAYYCECPNPEHNSFIYVDVENTDEFITWKTFYHYYYTLKEINENQNQQIKLGEGILKSDTPYVFNKKEYLDLIDNLENDLHKLKELFKIERDTFNSEFST